MYRDFITLKEVVHSSLNLQSCFFIVFHTKGFHIILQFDMKVYIGCNFLWSNNQKLYQPIWK
jgi:hypothetical protein